MEADYDLIVAGAGPAGSACAITAARRGARVLLLEKDRFPRHKVCGEFVSSESLRLLDLLLQNDPFQLFLQIPSARIFLDGKSLNLPVSPSARSISRYELDAALLNAARTAGVSICEQTAVRQVLPGRLFSVNVGANMFKAKAVVNATGRWSQLTRTRIKTQEKWIGLKAHFTEASPPKSVDLYFFAAGYCGVTPVSENAVNVCAMVNAEAATSLERVFALQPQLWRRSRDWEPHFGTISTSGLYFREPRTEDRGMLVAGDSAAFIDPFVGDGISLALHSGTVAAESLLPFIQESSSLAEAHQQYRAVYTRKLAPALRNAARIRHLLSAPAWLRSGLMEIAATRLVGDMLVQSTRVRA